MKNVANIVDEKDLPNYKIFWVDEKQHKHVVEKFKASNDDESYAKLEAYESKNDGHSYYYGKIHYARCINVNGKSSIRELCSDDASGLLDIFENNENFFMKIMSSIGDFFAFWLWHKPIDWWYSIKDAIYLLKHHEARSNQWNLDTHLIESIILNVPSLLKHSHGLMFLDDAILKLHGNEVGFDLNEYHEKHHYSYPKDVEDLAIEIQHDEYSKLLLNARLYKYYMDAGIVDSDNPDEVEFDKEWRHTLPVKSGTYDEFDYKKLNFMYSQAWDNVWDWVKKYGHTLYD